MNLEKYQDPLKVRIAETIINHFKELAPNGEDISQSHLDNLVLSEFNRIQEDAQQQQQQLQGECYQNQYCTGMERVIFTIFNSRKAKTLTRCYFTILKHRKKGPL